MKEKCPVIGKEKGSVLLTTIIILSFLSVLAMSLAAFLFSRQLSERLQIDRLQALYLAEAGIAKSIYELKSDIDLDRNGVGNVIETPLGGGTYQARHNFQTSSITAEGKVGNIARTIQIKYTAL